MANHLIGHFYETNCLPICHYRGATLVDRRYRLQARVKRDYAVGAVVLECADFGWLSLAYSLV